MPKTPQPGMGSPRKRPDVPSSSTQTGTSPSPSRRDPYRDLSGAYAEETSPDRIVGGHSARRVVKTGVTGTNRTPVPRPGRDWTVVRRCEECKGPVYAVRSGSDYAEQTEHRRGCSRAVSTNEGS